MRRWFLPVALALGLVGACGSFGADGADEPANVMDGGGDERTALPSADGGSGDADSTVTPSEVVCSNVPAPMCNGQVLIIGPNIGPESNGSKVTFSRTPGEDACGVLRVVCDDQHANNSFGYYGYDLPTGVHRFVLHQRIVGPVNAGSKDSETVPLTFGCGLFLHTKLGETIQSRFEISEDHYEIDGDNDKGTNPSGASFASSLPPSTAIDRLFDLDIEILPPKLGGGAVVTAGSVATTAHIDGAPNSASPIPFSGEVDGVTLRCGLLQADKKEEPCDLTIRQIALEICPP